MDRLRDEQAYEGTFDEQLGIVPVMKLFSVSVFNQEITIEIVFPLTLVRHSTLPSFSSSANPPTNTNIEITPGIKR